MAAATRFLDRQMTREQPDSSEAGSTSDSDQEAAAGAIARLNTVVQALSDKNLKRKESKLDTKVQKMRASFTSPKWWILVFGCVLAMCAGNVDVAGLKFWKICLANMTGNAAAIGQKIEGVTSLDDENYDVMYIITVVLAFVFGAWLCGLIIPSASVHLGGASFYGTALLGTSSLLITSALLVRDSPAYGHWRFHVGACCTAAACGLQNSMCTLHLGAVIRTTHVTGTLTDIGTLAGRATTLLVKKQMSKDKQICQLRQAQLDVDLEKLFVLTCLFISFVIGCTIGAFAWREHAKHSTNADTLYISAGITGVLGLVYTFFRGMLKRYFQEYERGRTREAVRGVLNGAYLAIGLGAAEDASELDVEEQVVDDLIEEAVAAQRSRSHSNNGR